MAEALFSIEGISIMESISSIGSISKVSRKSCPDSVRETENIAKQSNAAGTYESMDDISKMDILADIDGIEERLRRRTLMQLQLPRRKRILYTMGIMAALIILVYTMNIPNPNMILIAGLVLCSALFGYGGGITGAIIMTMYTLFFFSDDHSFVRFDSFGFEKVVVSFIGITADMLLVCSLKGAEIQAFNDIDDLVKRLHKKNEMLHTISMIDALTGIKNRMALRHDLELYLDADVTVIMLDLDDFKKINDTMGHEEGDRVLIETGRLLAEAFGRNSCYRYGGDEFVVICRTIPDEEFRDKLAGIRAGAPVVEMKGSLSKVGYSVGYIHKTVTDTAELKDMFSEADVRMYRAKRTKKVGRLRKEAPAG